MDISKIIFLIKLNSKIFIDYEYNYFDLFFDINSSERNRVPIMEFVIAGLVIIICLYIAGFFIKKKYYKEIDELESWKMDLMSRSVLDEMSKVKQLNMTGQTEELFENWRNEWDDIVTVQLPEVEEYLFDIEECIDKYRFKKAKSIKREIEEHLNKTEKNIDSLIEQINELVGSEEKNRLEIDELKEIYRMSKKMLLAHRHNFGKAESALEDKLDEIIMKFQEFEERTEHGDYLQARETVLMINSMLQDVTRKMEIIPNLLVECQSKIPSLLHEIKQGNREMIQQGYILDHVQMDKQIEGIESLLETHLSNLEKIETDEVEKGVEEIKNSIDFLYDLLEEEVKAKLFIHENEGKTKELLQAVQEVNEDLKIEIENVKQSYHLPENKLEEQSQLERKLRQVFEQFELLEHKIVNDETAHSLLRDELAGIKQQLETVVQDLTALSENLQTLRKDELAAREKVQELSSKIAESIRIISKSNIPGLSQEYLYLVEDAKDGIKDVKDKLDEKPIDVPEIQKYLEIAGMAVEKTYEMTIEIVETVTLVEKVIQYGNRYRSGYPEVAKGLSEAEQSFREFDYQTALEQAATSIEEIEPGALKKIESLLTEEVL